MKAYMLTTIDNPFDPTRDFDNWYLWDLQKGYNTCELIARIAETTDDFNDVENNYEVGQAIDFIIKNMDYLGIYKKIEFDEPMQNVEPDTDAILFNDQSPVLD